MDWLSPERRAEIQQVHNQMIDLLEEMNRNLKVDETTFLNISDFVRSVNLWLDDAEKDSPQTPHPEALGEARRHVRWMESNYHMTPYELRRKVPLGPSGSGPKTTEAMLERLRPPTGLQKYRETVIITAITATVTEVVTLSVLYLAHLL